MSVLLIAEHNNKELKPFTLNVINAATKINEDIHVLIMGHNADAVAKSVSEVSGVKKVIHVDNPIYENYVAENYVPEHNFLQHSFHILDYQHELLFLHQKPLTLI